jgi:porphobilinogen synthase
VVEPRFESAEPSPNGDPNGIRTRVTAVKGRCPRPLDDRVSKRAAEDGINAAVEQGDSYREQGSGKAQSAAVRCLLDIALFSFRPLDRLFVGSHSRAVLVFAICFSATYVYCLPQSQFVMSLYLPVRPRRLRQSNAIRRLVAETHLLPGDLIYPLFVHDERDSVEIPSMPGVLRHSIDSLIRECEEALAAGILAVAVFPSIKPGLKNARGTHGLKDDNLLYRAVRRVKQALPELVIITDVALDPYTTHGHDGVLAADGSVDNDETVAILRRLAVKEAQAGADIVAPSDMMDGRVAAIREALDEEGFQDTIILSYAAKYASAYYGPFREAVGSKIGKDSISKATYQMDPSNVREAHREIALDAEEGADIVMVKPAGPYLDVIRAVKESTNLPVAAYQVSGEYAQVHAAAKLGWLDYQRTRDEALLAIKRAGADIILTYFAKEVAGGMPRALQ